MLAAYFHTILFMSHYFVLSPDISIKKQYEETLFNYIKRKFIHLLIPYYLWNFTYGIVTQILDFTVIRKYSQQLIINAGKQCAKNRQAFSFLERMSVYFLPN